ncbi:SDR family NAD(P)-dependent oxidoreductase [Leuconostoc gelidum]|uniref:SDR family oxidoreductase n=1 Tax=Leuconostoc gelidum subsp. gelidum TaxID=1607839 RepID=A0AB35FZ53_LEUGE|nr:SDR family NAD(P)-dependent oxidoreductase [Leuconostoc gelidum]MBZ5965025.1 SDR family oxidoreductase [Leuconostoc gelidum subsp. gelidum]MBZ5974410.1 SDR family oxidoreductase [Leuconostoc gelidum subsp. gelidum]MBZ5977249.1 SDR family oxidoreductase [Leuconostoc gelidum subsp. gelidum]MBZ5986277.1 SDR family oxidoreductase [Leuconostoc gelidum subsp. gelidum]MBZ5998901.1 SDR family oxidoreductase [Leuconostoc gelidum subsp. gelidum]
MEKEEQYFSQKVFDLTEKVAIVTGGASGLGSYYTKALLSSGASVLVVSYDDKGVREMASFASEFTGKIEFLQLDITKKDAAITVANEVIKRFGKVDILINNAGIQIRNDWQVFKDADWEKVINLNLNAVYYLSHEIAKVMNKENGGKIINIGSMQSFRAGKYIFPYTASKHGVIGLTKSYADALAPLNIQVNAIAPGYIDTPMTKPLQEDKERNTEILSHIPAGHWADPSELMGAIIFLSSSASNYITGITLPVDGGYLLR